MECVNDSNKVVNSSCWLDTSTSATSGSGYDSSWKDKYKLGATCEWFETSSSGSSSSYNSYSNWCEVCTTANGTVLDDYNSCGDDWDYADDDDDNTWDGGEDCIKWDSKGNCTFWEDNWEDDKLIVDPCEVWDQTCEEEEQDDHWNNYSGGGIDWMWDSVEWLEDSLTQFSRFDDRMDRVIEDYERSAEWAEKDKEWMEEEGIDTSFLDDINAQREEDVEAMTDDAKSISIWETDFELTYKAIVDALNDAPDSLTQEEGDAYNLFVRKGDVYNLVWRVYDMKISLYQMASGYYEWEKEAEKTLARIGDADLSSDVQSEIDDAYGYLAEFETARSDMDSAVEVALRAIGDLPSFDSVDDLIDNDSLREEVQDYLDGTYWDASDTFSDAQNDIWNLSYDQQLMWDSLKGLYDMQYVAQSQDWMLEEITNIRADIVTVTAAFEMLETKITDSNILKKIDEVLSIADKAETMLDGIQDDVTSGDVESKEMEQFWGDLDKLGRTIEPRVEKVLKYVEKSSINLSSADQSLLDAVEDLMQEDHGQCNNCGRLNDIYDQDTADYMGQYISDDMLNDLITQITSAVAESLMQYVDDEVSQKVLQAVLAHLDQFKKDKFGADFANDLLENQSTVLASMEEIDFDDTNTSAGLAQEVNELETLYDEMVELPMPDADLATEVSDYWTDVSTIINGTVEATEEEMTELVTEGQHWLAECVAAKYEYNLGLNDVPGPFDEGYDDTWYAGYVFEGLGDQWQGYKDSTGELTYTYGPSDTTLRAEALKMVLAALGYEESGSDGGSNWWAGWQSAGQSEGLTLASADLSQSVTRGEVFRLMFEATGMTGSAYQGYFPDVNSSVDYSPVEALYEAGMVTGDGDTGYARLNDTLNRAEVAALISRMMEWDETESFIDEDLVAYTDSGVSIASEEEGFWSNVLGFMSRMLSKLLPANLF